MMSPSTKLKTMCNDCLAALWWKCPPLKIKLGETLRNRLLRIIKTNTAVRLLVDCFNPCGCTDADIDSTVVQMLKDDSVVGRWIRLTYPEQFEKFLLRARQDARLRRKQHNAELFVVKAKGRKTR